MLVPSRQRYLIPRLPMLCSDFDRPFLFREAVLFECLFEAEPSSLCVLVFLHIQLIPFCRGAATVIFHISLLQSCGYATYMLDHVPASHSSFDGHSDSVAVLTVLSEVLEEGLDRHPCAQKSTS